MSKDVPLLDSTRKVVIIGAGPVGCLAAIAFAKMNWQVQIYEARPGKSITMSMFSSPNVLILFFQIYGYHLRKQLLNSDLST